MSSSKKISQENKGAEKKKNITNTKQFERLVDIMEKNAELAKGFFTFGNSKSDYMESWQSVAIQLNSLGPPGRDGAGWQKVWNDLKTKIKKKLGHNKKEISATGGGSNNLYIFSQLEESVISLLCLEKTCSASNNAFGLVRNSQLPSTSNCQQQSSISSSSIHQSIPETRIQNVEHTPQGSTQAEEIVNNGDNPPIHPTPNQQKRKRSITVNYQEERRQLLENQTRNIEVQTKQIKECARYSRKLYELHEKKFKMWSQIQNEKRTFRQLSIEYKLKELEYKERKLELQECNNY